MNVRYAVRGFFESFQQSLYVAQRYETGALSVDDVRALLAEPDLAPAAQELPQPTRVGDREVVGV